MDDTQREDIKPEDILGIAAAWHDEGERTAIATVVDTWGSAPRPRGSRMALTASGRMAGSVSGGCVEGAVVEAGQEAMADGKTRLLTFGVSDGEAWAVGLACGGTVRIFVEPVTA